MLKIVWNEFKGRPVITCGGCGQAIVTHQSALVGWPACEQCERVCVIVHAGCKQSFESRESQKWVWLPVEDFFWLVADELGVMRKVVWAVKRKPRRNKKSRQRDWRKKSV